MVVGVNRRRRGDGLISLLITTNGNLVVVIKIYCVNVSEINYGTTKQ